MAPRRKHHSTTLSRRTLILDNGAHTIKAGFASANQDQPSVIPNCIARSRDKRVYIGAQIEKCSDFGEMAFRRPVERGFIANWEAQKTIWENSFFDKGAALHCDPHETNLILTEAPNSPAVLQTHNDQIIFEEFEFAGYYRTLSAPLNAFTREVDAPSKDSRFTSRPLLVIDSGYSHTTITPVIEGRAIQSAIRRLDIGGKFLTNYLNELVSLRHYDLRDEPHLLNDIKEDATFVSDHFSRDLDAVWKAAKNPSKRPPVSVDAMDEDINFDRSALVDYVLPDYETLKKGYLRPHDPTAAAKARRLANTGDREHVLPLGNERFVVPELLFHPQDVGMQEAGLPDVVMQVLHVLPEALRGPMLANVTLVGGNAKIRGLRERLEVELRARVEDHMPIRVVVPNDPITATWHGAAHLARNTQALRKIIVTRQQYQEHGATWLSRQFASTAPT